MKKVFLYMYDKINLGDDLFVHNIVSRYPDVQFYLWSSKENKSTFHTLRNLKVLDKDSRGLQLLGKIRASLPARYKAYYEEKCDVVVYIGGSLFIEYDNWETILSWWEYEAENRPFYVLGANFGPYVTEAYRIKLNSIFNKMRDVCFRDKYSHQKFKDNPIIRSAPDILFSTNMPKVTETKKQVFLSVIDLLSKDEGCNVLAKYDKEYCDKIIQIVNGFVKLGYSVVMSSFCKYEGDEKMIERIIDALDNTVKSNVQVLNYDGTNHETILLKMAESEAIIASRFHAVVLGIVSEKPVFPIVYSDKIIHVLEDIEFIGDYVEIRSLETLNFNKVYSSLEKKQSYPVKGLQEMAQKHFAKLDDVLN